MQEGILAALDAIEKATGEKKVNAVGYCVGGTLLAVTLGYMAAIGDERIASATLLATQVDFEFAGDLKVFVDADRIAEHRGGDEEGRLSRRLEDGQRLQPAALERPDLALRREQLPEGKGAVPLRPPLLERRRDAHAERQPLLLPAQLLPGEQALQGRACEIAGETIDLSKVTIPIYNLATKEDHIAPAKSVFVGSALLRRAGALRARRAPATSPAWSTRRRARNISTGSAASRRGRSRSGWSAAEERPGSWWDDWQAWIEAHRRHAR